MDGGDQPGARTAAAVDAVDAGAAADPGADAAAGDLDDVLLDACRELPARQRAVVVLRFAEGRSEAATAAALRTGTATVATLTDRAFDRLAAALAAHEALRTLEAGVDLGEVTHAPETPPSPARPVPQPPLEELLGAAFARTAAGGLPTEDFEVQATRAWARHRSVTLAALALASLALVGAVVAGAALANHPARPAAPAAPRAPATGRFYQAWPTRGDLADRADLLALVRERAGAADVHAVPFVGEVAGEDVALVVTGRGASPELVVLHGPHGSAPSTWARSWGSIDDDDLPVLLTGAFGATGADTVSDGSDVRMVVVTESRGVTAAYSPRTTFGPDGVPRRSYTPLPLADGVAAVLVPGSSARVTVRATAGGTTRETVVHEAPTVSAAQIVDHALIRPSAASCDSPDTVDRIVRGEVAAAQLSLADVRAIDVRACRRLGQARFVAVAILTRPGAVLLHAQLDERLSPDAETQVTEGGPVRAGQSRTYPLVVVLGRDAGVAGLPPVAPLVAFSAPGGATAELARRDGSGRVLGPVPLDAEGVALTSPRAADWMDALDDLDLVVRDARGHEVRRVPASSPLGVWGVGGAAPLGR